MTAKGKFEVKMQPLEAYAAAKAGATLGRMSIDKTFSGDLEAVSQGEMLSAMTTVKGSAGYVAIEQVEGTLAGKAGTFILQHFGTLEKGADRLVLEVVPDSGTGALEGLSGTMQIVIEDGQHFYEFAYTV